MKDKQTADLDTLTLQTIAEDIAELAKRLGVPVWAVYASEPLPTFKDQAADAERKFTLSMTRSRGKTPGSLKLVRTIEVDDPETD